MRSHWFSWFIWLLIVALDIFVLWATTTSARQLNAGLLIAFNVVALITYALVRWLEEKGI